MAIAAENGCDGGGGGALDDRGRLKGTMPKKGGRGSRGRGSVLDRVTSGGAPIQFGFNGRRGGRGARRTPARGFDFGGGLERERQGSHGGGDRDHGSGPGGPPAWQGGQGGPPTQQQPPRPASKLLGKMSGLREAVAARGAEKEEERKCEEEKAKKKEKENLKKATAALIAAETSEDPSELRAAAKRAEPFKEHSSGVKAARKRADRIEDVERLMSKAQTAADRSNKQDIISLGNTLKHLKKALDCCDEFQRLGNEEELRSQQTLAESRRTMLEEQADRERSAAAGLKAVAESEDIEKITTAVTAAVVFDSLSKETAAMQSRIKRLEQLRRSMDLCDARQLDAIRHPHERVERLNAALAGVAEFKKASGSEGPRLREQLAAAKKLAQARKEKPPPPLPQTHTLPSAEKQPAGAAAAAAAAQEEKQLPTVVVPPPKEAVAAAPSGGGSAAAPKASPRTIPHANGIKSQPKTASLRIHKEQMSLTLPMLGGDYAAHRSAKESTALSRKRKEVLLSRQVHLFRVDGYYTSAQEQDYKVADPRPSREYMDRNLAGKEYRSVGFTHSKEASGIRHRTLFVDKLVAPSNPDDVAECFELLGRVHEAQVWTVPPLMDQPARCFAMVSITTTAAAVAAFATDVLATVGNRVQASGPTADEEAKHDVAQLAADSADAEAAAGGWVSSVISTPGPNAVHLSNMAIHAGSAVVVLEDSDRKLIETAQKELQDAQSLLSSIDASVSMSSSSTGVRNQEEDLPAGSPTASASPKASPRPLEETQVDARVARFKVAIKAEGNEAVFATPSYFTPDADGEKEPAVAAPAEKEQPVAAAAVDPAPRVSPPDEPPKAAEGTEPATAVDIDVEATITGELKRTVSVKKLKKRLPAVKLPEMRTDHRPALLAKMLSEHFTARCQHRFEPVSAVLEQGFWHLDFADSRERDVAFDSVNGTLFRVSSRSVPTTT